MLFLQQNSKFKMNAKVKKVLWLFPYSKFFENSVPNMVTAKNLNTKNIFVFCKKGFFDYCGPHQAAKVSTLADKNKICNICINNSQTISKLANGRSYWIHKTKQTNIPYFKEKILKKFCRLDNSLNTKHPIINTKNVLPQYLESAKVSLLASERILQKEKPDIVVSDNSLYANFNCWRWTCSKRKIPFYSAVSGPLCGSSFRFFHFTKNFSNNWYDEALKKWRRINKNRININKYNSLVEKHLSILQKGLHYIVYSSKKKAPNVFFSRLKHLRKHYKKIVLIALSSEDEALICGLTSGRYKKLKWLGSQNKLIQWVNKNAIHHPKIFFILRLHPRIAKTQRDGIESSDLSKKLQLLRFSPPNVYYDLPPDQPSIYKLFDSVDLVLSTWSSVGWEAAALGIPSVCLSPERTFYPEELNNVKISSYRELSEKLFDEKTYKINPSKKLLAKQWYSFLYQYGILELPPILGKLGESKGLLQGFWFRLMRIFDPTYDIRFFYRRACKEPVDVSKLLKLFQTRATSFFNI